MNLDGFSCKNSLNKKYIVKGFMTNKNEDKISYCLLKNDKKKYLLNINLNPVKIFNLIEVEEFGTGKIYDFEPVNFYKPLGYMEANFHIARPDKNKLYSNMFLIQEDKENLLFKFIEKDRFYKLNEMDFIEHLNDEVWVPNSVIVHNGKMHADDILCVSLLKYLNNDIKIIRTRDIPEDFSGIVCDVGSGRYDHHELNKFRKDNLGNQYYLPDGRPELYAAFGLLAKDILPGLIGQKNYFLIDHQIIRALDNADNYGTFSDLAYFFSLFNPAWNEEKTSDEAFLEAVEYGTKFISEIVLKEKARQQASPYVQSKIAKSTDNILLLEHRVPWQTAAKKSNILFAIYPTEDGLFALQATPTIESDARTKTNKIDMPEYWLENPPNGCYFVHKTLFFATFDTHENAIEAAKEAIKNGKDNRRIH